MNTFDMALMVLWLQKCFITKFTFYWLGIMGCEQMSSEIHLGWKCFQTLTFVNIRFESAFMGMLNLNMFRTSICRFKSFLAMFTFYCYLIFVLSMHWLTMILKGSHSLEVFRAIWAINLHLEWLENKIISKTKIDLLTGQRTVVEWFIASKMDAIFTRVTPIIWLIWISSIKLSTK